MDSWKAGPPCLRSSHEAEARGTPTDDTRTIIKSPSQHPTISGRDRLAVSADAQTAVRPDAVSEPHCVARQAERTGLAFACPVLRDDFFVIESGRASGADHPLLDVAGLSAGYERP